MHILKYDTHMEFVPTLSNDCRQVLNYIQLFVIIMQSILLNLAQKSPFSLTSKA